MVCAGGVRAAHAWDFGAGIAVTYDDNILLYSERDLFAFRYRLNPPRFNLETTDDLILAPYAEIAWESRSSRPSSVLARAVVNRYATNTIRDNFEYLLQYRAWLSRRWRLTLAGTFLPSYYARRYVDDDLPVPFPELPRYRDAKYRQTGAATSLEWRPARAWRGQLGLEYRRRDFLGDGFRERDENRYALRLSVRPPRAGRVTARLRGSYGRALARTEDGDEAGGPPDDPDVSTRSVAGGVSLEYLARSVGPIIVLRQALDFESRPYTTTDASDTQRFGRSIHETDLDWDLALGISRNWQISASYAITWQRLTGSLSNIQTFTDAASYNRQRVSIRLGWTSRQRQAPTADAE